MVEEELLENIIKTDLITMQLPFAISLQKHSKHAFLIANSKIIAFEAINWFCFIKHIMILCTYFHNPGLQRV